MTSTRSGFSSEEMLASEWLTLGISIDFYPLKITLGIPFFSLKKTVQCTFVYSNINRNIILLSYLKISHNIKSTEQNILS